MIRRRYFDVCNGDADGLCAVLQWRLHAPADAALVTGLKREIELLERVQGQPGDEVLVCDLSMQRNRQALLRLLGQGAHVRYFDHHESGDIPTDPNLESHVDMDENVCTSLLMDRNLGGAYRRWALVGAYGDNLIQVADALALQAGLNARQCASLRTLGAAINYNAYGDSLDDVRIAPSHLYAIMRQHADPFEMIDQQPIVAELVERRRADLEHGRAIAPLRDGPDGAVRLLPDAPWSRRVMGSLAHELARLRPDQAQAVLRLTAGGHYVVSVRAPLASPRGAVAVCARFGGAGRAGAAGIDRLAPGDLERFIEAFEACPWEAAAGRPAAHGERC